MKPARRQQQPVVSVIPALGLVLLAASGLVLATSWLIGYSAPVLAMAVAIAIMAVISVAVTGWREARLTGIGYLASLGASMKRLGRFAIDFF